MDNYNNNNNYNNNYNNQPQQTYDAQPQQSYDAQPYQPDMPAEDKKDGKAIASLILGIVSILCCNPIFACSIIGIIMGVQSKKANPDNNTLATVGIILSAVGIVFTIIGAIVVGVMVATGAFASSGTSYSYGY